MKKRTTFAILSVVLISIVAMQYSIPATLGAIDTDYYTDEVAVFYAYTEFYVTKATPFEVSEMKAKGIEPTVELVNSAMRLNSKATEEDDLDYYIGIGEDAIYSDYAYTEEEAISGLGGNVQMFNTSAISSWTTSTSASYYADTESEFAGSRYYVGGEKTPNQITESYALSQSWTFVNVSTFQVLTFAKGIEDISTLGVGFHTSVVSTMTKSGKAVSDVLQSAFFPILRSQTTSESNIFGKISTVVTRPFNKLIELTGNVVGDLLNKPEGATHYYPTTVPSTLYNNRLFALGTQFSLSGFIRSAFNWFATIMGSSIFAIGVIGLGTFAIIKRRKRLGKTIKRKGKGLLRG